MRAVIQRVREASVTVDGAVIGVIDRGLLVFLGVSTEDDASDVPVMVRKIAQMRIFNDGDGKFNLSVGDVGGSVLVVSQFTLLGDTRKGNRPSFVHAARPDQAIPLYEAVAQGLRDRGLPVETGEFGAHMDVRFLNEGPVTILVDTRGE